MSIIKVLVISAIALSLAACAGVSRLDGGTSEAAKSKGIPIVFNWVRHDPPNSAGGVDVWIFFVNTSDKPIKYVSMNMEAYNRVGDVVKSTIGGDMIKVLRAVGPIEPGLGNGGSFFNSSKTTSYENVWYNNSITCVRVASADIEYMDGSTDTIGPERIADAIKPGIKNTCELGEQLR